MLGPGILAMFIVYGLLYWVGMARIVRGQVLQLKEMEYVNAARALGADNKRLIFKHLLPNCIGQLVVTTMLSALAIMTVSAVVPVMYFAREKCRELQRKIQSVATR